MKGFKRLTLGVFARIDEMIAQVENHDAVVNSVVQDMRRAATSAKVQLEKVQQDGELLGERSRFEHESAQRWRTRAAGCVGQNEEQALQCLWRARASQQRAAQLDARLADHERTQKQLQDDVGQIHQRLRELYQKQDMLRTRRSRARALQRLNEEHPPIEKLQELFEQWETRVTELECSSDCDDRTDGLDNALFSLEDEDNLRHELQTLKEQARRQGGQS